MNIATRARRGAWPRTAPAALLVGLALVLGGCEGGEPGTPDTMAGGTTTPAAEPAAPSPERDTSGPTEPTATDETEPAEMALAPGSYRDYDPAAVADPGYDTTILFFHASWCPECRAFEQSIEAGPIPDGVQILKVDYDASDDLKRQYEVTIQTTFVKVDADGERLSSWVGYQKDRSIRTILDELE
jgi:hypothetical protein